MIKQEMVLNYFNYKEPYYASYHGMRYALSKVTTEERLSATTWPEPFCYEVTPDEQKISKEFLFNEEGYKEAITWLNEEYKEHYMKK